MSGFRVYHMVFFQVGVDRPVIDFRHPANGDKDWGSLGPILDGSRSAKRYREVRFAVARSDACEWHSYSVGGTFGLISDLAAKLLSEAMNGTFEPLEAKINDCRYRFLRTVSKLDCLNRAESSIEMYPDESDGIADIHRYLFRKEKLRDPCLFTIPEIPRLFATESAKRVVQEVGLKGFYFSDAESEPNPFAL